MVPLLPILMDNPLKAMQFAPICNRPSPQAVWASFRGESYPFSTLYPVSVRVRRRPSDSNFGTRRQGNHISGDFDDASFVLPSNHFKSHNRGVVQASRDSNSSHSTLTQLEGQQAKSLYRNGHSQTPRSNPPPVRARGMTVGAIATRRPSTAAGALEQAPSGSATSLLGSIQTRGINTARLPGSFIPPSYSPITFHRNRSLSNATDSNSPDSFHGTRPLVLVRKASSPRVAMPPPLATPPSSGLPPLPSSPGSQSFIESVEDLSSLVFPDNPSSSSSSLSFASDTGFDMVGADGDEIYNLMRDSFVDNDFRLDTFPPRSPPATIRNVNVGTSSPVKRSSSSRMHPGDTAHPRLLKKAISQQSLLGKRFSGASVASSIASGSVATDDTSMRGSIINSLGMKIPRKQRSFHHPLIPLPPLPSLRHANSACTPPNSSTDTSVSSPAQSPTVPEHRKPVASPQHTRKRLFSGSSTRRSSSSQPPASPTSVDEDIRSIVSHEGETRSLERRKPLMMSFSNIGNQISLVTDNACIAASWDDVTPPPLPPKDSPRKRESQSESLPQRIMSPAAMLKLEEQLAAEAAERERDEQLKNHENEQKPTPKLQLDAIDLGLSFANRRPKSNRSRAGSTISDMSVATFGKSERISPISTINHHSLMHHEGTTSRRSSVKTPSVQTVEELHFPVRSSSVMVGRTTKPPLLSIRPSTTQAAITPPMSPVSIAPSPGRSTSSLPPPHLPRPPRERETFERDEEIGFKRASILPIHPLSPPPRRKSAKPTVAFEPQDRHVQQRPPPSAFDPQKFTNRRSIVKRPSFLDIDDEEVDQEVETSLSPMESSFLDLDRGKDSFDTLRSFDDELRVY